MTRKETNDESERRNGGDTRQLHLGNKPGLRSRNPVETELRNSPNRGCSTKGYWRRDGPDVSIALGTRNRLPGEITVGQVASGNVFGCKADDDVRTALATMGEAKVRRLPVINANGKLEGILSMDDVVLHSEARIPGRTPELSHDDVVDTLKKLYRPELPRVVPQKAAA